MPNGSVHRPLVVDLDGTLIKTDLLAETASRFLIEQPFRFFKLLVWLAEGKSALKPRLAETTRLFHKIPLQNRNLRDHHADWI